MKALDNYLSLHANAVKVRSIRAQYLASNIANADTPGYRPKDIDFNQVLQKSVSEQQGSRSTTHPRHINVIETSSTPTPYIRDSHQRALDKNTTNSEYERTQFTENAIRTQASIQMLSGKINGLIRALRGE